MAVTVLAAWMVGSLRSGRRIAGFWCFLLSNVLWVLWGVPANAWGLIVLQVFLAGMNVRGLLKNEHSRQPDADAPDPPAGRSTKH